MRVREALELFANLPKIRKVLKTLADVGLDYLALGQAAPTLSGGESQRVKLAAELARPSTGRTLYLLDEPTTGLHFDDVHKLLEVLHRLVDLGNTVIVIEHNLDVIKTADWIIDLGPEAGPRADALSPRVRPKTWCADALTVSHTGAALLQCCKPGRARTAAYDPSAPEARQDGDVELEEVGPTLPCPGRRTAKSGIPTIESRPTASRAAGRAPSSPGSTSGSMNWDDFGAGLESAQRRRDCRVEPNAGLVPARDDRHGVALAAGFRVGRNTLQPRGARQSAGHPAA